MTVDQTLTAICNHPCLRVKHIIFLIDAYMSTVKNGVDEKDTFDYLREIYDIDTVYKPTTKSRKEKFWQKLEGYCNEIQRHLEIDGGLLTKKVEEFLSYRNPDRRDSTLILLAEIKKIVTNEFSLTQQKMDKILSHLGILKENENAIAAPVTARRQDRDNESIVLQRIQQLEFKIDSYMLTGNHVKTFEAEDLKSELTKGFECMQSKLNNVIKRLREGRQVTRGSTPDVFIDELVSLYCSSCSPISSLSILLLTRISFAAGTSLYQTGRPPILGPSTQT